MNPEFEKWLEDKPPIIKELAKKYPPGRYIIKEGAPYVISAPGTTVEFYSYNSDGSISVVVLPENKSPEVLAMEEFRALKHNKTKKQIEEIHKSPVKVEIDPIYLKPLK